MNKKLYLAASAFLTLGSGAYLPTFTKNNPQNCTGHYYEGVNSFFVDCYDPLGTLISQNEQLYEFSLVSTCYNTTFSSFESETAGWMIPVAVTGTTELLCCDYFQRTVGYVFTECD